MKDFMGIINLSEVDEKIKELTLNRPIAAIPFAGRYRVIDFMLSNLVNSGVENIGIYTHNKYRSLSDHLGSGKPWDLDRKLNGLFVLNPMYDYNDVVRKIGDLEHFAETLNYLWRSKQKYVILSRSYMVANINYSEVFKYHKDSDADVTMIYKSVKNEEMWHGRDVLNIDGEGMVQGIGKNLGTSDEVDLSMEMYLMKKELMIKIIEDAVEAGNANYMKQAIFAKIPSLKVNTYEYNGYLSCITSTESYYNASMELLNRDMYQELFYNHGIIFTKVKDEPSTSYADTSYTSNSIIANGCIIEGTVENSIVFRGVHVKKGAIVRNSIVMQGATIGRSANLESVILDKNAKISENKMLKGDPSSPYVVKKGVKI